MVRGLDMKVSRTQGQSSGIFKKSYFKTGQVDFIEKFGPIAHLVGPVGWSECERWAVDRSTWGTYSYSTVKPGQELEVSAQGSLFLLL